MPLGRERAKELREKTQAHAQAVLEDLHHIRGLFSNLESQRAELRGLSVKLRRLLLDGEIGRVARPRTGELALAQPDNLPFYRLSRSRPQPEFFGSGGVTAQGVWGRALVKGPIPGGFNPSKTVSVPLDNFLKQQVLCFRGQWVSRKDTIQYVANAGSGAHTGLQRIPEKQKQAFALIDRCRGFATYQVQGKAMMLKINQGAPSAPNLTYEMGEIDVALLEVLAAAHFLVISPDVAELEVYIRRELGAHGSS